MFQIDNETHQSVFSCSPAERRAISQKHRDTDPWLQPGGVNEHSYNGKAAKWLRKCEENPERKHSFSCS